MIGIWSRGRTVSFRVRTRRSWLRGGNVCSPGHEHMFSRMFRLVNGVRTPVWNERSPLPAGRADRCSVAPDAETGAVTRRFPLGTVSTRCVGNGALAEGKPTEKRRSARRRNLGVVGFMLAREPCRRSDRPSASLRPLALHSSISDPQRLRIRRERSHKPLGSAGPRSAGDRSVGTGSAGAARAGRGSSRAKHGSRPNTLDHRGHRRPTRATSPNGAYTGTPEDETHSQIGVYKRRDIRTLRSCIPAVGRPHRRFRPPP